MSGIKYIMTLHDLNQITLQNCREVRTYDLKLTWKYINNKNWKE